MALYVPPGKSLNRRRHRASAARIFAAGLSISAMFLLMGALVRSDAAANRAHPQGQTALEPHMPSIGEILQAQNP